MIEMHDLPHIPPLVFTVSITGHQDIPSADHAALQDHIAGLLEQTRLQLLHDMAGSEIDRNRALHCRFVSALAPGADQIGARAMLAAAGSPDAAERGWKLQAVLPFAQALCADLAAATLRARGVDQTEIATARAAIADLAGKADRVLELADWQPGDDTRLAEHWQSRRYATIGQMLVRQADLLIALWDGRPPRGAGGTADVVSEARRCGVPVIWIDPALPGIANSLVPDAGSRHLPASDVVARYRNNDSRVQALICGGPDAAIAASIVQVLLGHDPARATCIARYRDEAPPQAWIVQNDDGATETQPGDRHRAYAAMLYYCLNLPARLKRERPAEDRAQGSPPLDLRSYPFRNARQAGAWFARKVLLYPFGFEVGRGEPGTVNAAPLLDHAARADALATRLSNQYRSAYVKIFALAPVAVTWAVLSAMLPDFKPAWVTLELLTVGLAASIYMRTRARDPVAAARQKPRWWRRWLPRAQDTHQRWLDARLIAESQRSGQLLAWLGFSGRRPLESTFPARAGHGPQAEDHGEAAAHVAPRTVWAPHYANAIAALPELPMDEATAGRRAAITPQRVARIAQAAGKVISGQMEYHDLNHQRLEKLNHRLDAFSLRAIIVAFAVSASYLLLWVVNQPVPFDLWPAQIDEHHPVYGLYFVLKQTAAFFGAVLPAVAAAAAGIRFQGDFERFAMRSQDTAQRLAGLAERARRIGERAQACGDIACSGQPPLVEPLLGLLADTQAVLDEDLADWRFAYAARPITLG